MEDRVVRILPALIGEALLGRAVIFDEAVADRGSPGPSIQASAASIAGHSSRKRLVVAGALDVEAGEQHEQRRRIDAAVIEAERHLAQRRHLAARASRAGSCPARASAAGSLSLAWKAASRRSTPRAMPGSHHSICSAVIRPSRPNVVEYQGMPA